MLASVGAPRLDPALSLVDELAPIADPPDRRLAEVVVELARAAVADLALRDVELGFARVPPEQRTGLHDTAAGFADRVAELAERWDQAVDREPRLAGLEVDEQVVLALACAPELDRGLARALRRVVDEPVLTVGALCDLASDELEARWRLMELLEAGAPLVERGLLAVVTSCASASVTVAPAVVLALRRA